MSSSTLRPASCRLPPVTRGSGSQSKVLKVEMVKRPALPCLQATKKEEKPLLQEFFKATSRREIMHLAAASLGFLSLLLPESAEARTRNADIRKKILEKLEELREKAGFSKPKVEGQEKNPKDEAEEKKSNAKDEGQEKNPKDEAEEKKLKPKIEAEEKNTKPNDEIEGKKATPQHSTAPPSEGLPLPLPSIINGKTVETNLS
ncbi:Hypothetical predicted protein [Olea europaea subsp. europaea]|uniref:Uncharacterized protein n=1 Tax=Olea europaea subsp. europaea TaxID=158383 RepID=A0A8S0QVJ4_OLEEU|nr:Hypothetical predicted protein [Olea europaea subsp. europaea]